MKEVDLAPTEGYRIGDVTLRLSSNNFQRYFIMVIKAEEIEKRIWWPLMTVIGYQDFVKKNRPKKPEAIPYIKR